jgi:hypothetical protein
LKLVAERVMGILGKLLIVFNLLAAGAFAYFVVQDWKVRQDITYNALARQVQLEGIALEPQTPPPTADELEDGRVAFYIVMPGNVTYRTIPKSKLDAMIPNGGTLLGGEAVSNQTDEVKRLQTKVFANIPAQGQQRFDWLRTYLVSVVRTGAERDGVAALFDIRDEARRPAARRDLPLIARTSSQVAALQAMVDISNLGDPQAIMPETARTSRIALARQAVKDFLKAEVPYGAETEEARRNLTNKVEDATAAGAGEAQKAALIDAATADKTGWTQLANVAVEPLADKPSCDRANAGLLAYAQGKAMVDTEKAGLKEVADLITKSQQSPLPQGFNLDKTVDSAAVNMLNSKFDDAIAPASSGKAGKGDPHSEKARKIAHLLFHIDAWRHTDAPSAADRKAWHERVATIVGLPEYIRAAEAQATEYAEAQQRLIAVISEEESAFQAEYQSLVQRVRSLFAEWQLLDNQLKSQEAITRENERLRNERQTEKTKLEEDLKNAQEAAKVANEKLKKTQARQFAIQKDLRDAQTAILALEKELRRIELSDGRGER